MLSDPTKSPRRSALAFLIAAVALCCAPASAQAPNTSLSPKPLRLFQVFGVLGLIGLFAGAGTCG